MAISYECRLFFPTAQLHNVLQDLSTIAVLGVPPCNVVVGVPSYWPQYSLDWNFRFEMDEVLERYIKETRESDYRDWIDAANRVAIDGIYLGVDPSSHYNPQLAEFNFSAVAKSASRLLIESPSIRKTFQRLLRDHEGECGFIQDADYSQYGPELIYPEGYDLYNNLLRRDDAH